MDPNANLKEQLQLAVALVEIDPEEMEVTDLFKAAGDAQRLAELVLALDGWLNGGGFFPKQWQR